jgi:methyl-accepting chemotaxis protein
MMDTTPFVLGGLGFVIVRQYRSILKQSEEIGSLEAQKRDSFEKTAHELFHAAQGLLGNVSAFTSTTAETAASVRETTATMTQLSQTATQAALTAETVIGLAMASERASEDGLHTAENASTELVKLAEEVQGLSQRIQGLNDKMRDIFEIASVVNYIADRSQRLAESAAEEARKAGTGGAGFDSVAGEMRRHAEDAKKAAAQVKGILSEVHRAMVAAMTAAEVGSRRAQAGADVASQTGATIRKLAAALRESSKAAKDIARVAQQQDQGIEQVMKAMNEIYVATEDTVASTHQVAAEAKSLNELAQSLKATTRA